jgi:hypothetical protein
MGSGHAGWTGNPARFPAVRARWREPMEAQHRPGPRGRAALPGTPAAGLQKETTHVNTNPDEGDGPRLSVLLVVAAAAAVAAQSEAWATSVGTAVALYSVLTTGSRRN